MKKHSLLLLFALNFLAVFAQIEFEEGYLIDSIGHRVECLIKNRDWKYNPKFFQYKLSDEQEAETAKPEDVLEFGINGKFKFVSREVEIDRSGDNSNEFSEVRGPKFTKEHLFLEVLIEGKANLYVYDDNNRPKYFFSLEGIPTQQLIYKQYKVEGRIADNNYFRYQMFEYLKCPSLSMDDFNDVDYYRKELERIFTRYTQCLGGEIVTIKKKEKRDWFNLTVRPGIQYAWWETQTSDAEFKDFGGDIGARLGLEGEFVLPFNKNKWAIIIEPTYQTYQSEKWSPGILNSSGDYIMKVDYRSIELPIGLRYYIFLNKDFKVYVEGTRMYNDFDFDSKLTYEEPNGNPLFADVNLEPSSGYGLGGGIKAFDRVVFGFRYQFRRNLYSLDYSNYKQMAMYFGYTLF